MKTTVITSAGECREFETTEEAARFCHELHAADERAQPRFIAVGPVRADEMVAVRQDIHAEIEVELARALAKYPDCVSLPNGTGASGYKTYETIARLSCDRAQREGRLTHAHVFEEETAEVLAADTPATIRHELVQVGAMVFKWIRDIDRKASNDYPKEERPTAVPPPGTPGPTAAAGAQGGAVGADPAVPVAAPDVRGATDSGGSTPPRLPSPGGEGKGGFDPRERPTVRTAGTDGPSEKGAEQSDAGGAIYHGTTGEATGAVSAAPAIDPAEGMDPGNGQLTSAAPSASGTTDQEPAGRRDLAPPQSTEAPAQAGVGRPADGGQAAVPAGFRLGAGWKVVRGALDWRLHKREGSHTYSVAFGSETERAHAMMVGALVPIEPPVAEARADAERIHPAILMNAQRSHSPPSGRLISATPVKVPAPVAEPAQPVCKAWCGTDDGSMFPRANGDKHWRDGIAYRYFCSRDCFDCKKPLNPPPVPPGPHVVIATVDASERTAPENITLFVPPGPVPSPRRRDFYEMVKDAGPLPTTAMASAESPPGPVPPEGEPVRSVGRSRSDASLGLYEKFRIERTDGKSAPGKKHHGCSYFVLDLDHDEFAPPALRAYADACAEAFPALAADLRRLATQLAAPSPAPGPVPPEGEPVEARCNCVLRDASEPHDLDCPQRPAAPAKAPLSTRLRASVRSNRMDARGEIERHADELEAMESQLATAIRERDEQRGRAERAEAILADVSRRYGFVQQEADARVAEAYRTGWADGAEKTREASCQAAQNYASNSAAARSLLTDIRALPLPVCPEGPSVGTRCGNLDCGPNCTHGMSLVCGHDDEDSECNNQRCAQADAIKAAVAGERERCLAWFEFFLDTNAVRISQTQAGIGSGADAPDAGTGAVTSGEAGTSTGSRLVLDVWGLCVESDRRDTFADRVKVRRQVAQLIDDAIKAAVDRANNRAADAFYRRENVHGSEFDVMDADEFDAWVRSGADAPGAGKDGGK